MEKRLRKHLPGGKFKDVTETRSRAMSAVRGRNNKTTEIRLRYALVRSGIAGWRLHPSDLPGKPDFVFPEHQLAVFVDGCFWHGCPNCGHYPKKHAAFWKAKIRRNRQRDRQKTASLEALGFTVLRFWEHELQSDIPHCLGRIGTALASS